MNSKQLMSFDDVVEFFSSTHEFQVSDSDGDIKISFTDSLKPGEVCSTLIWKKHVNVQGLIRVITKLVWNMNNNNFDTPDEN